MSNLATITNNILADSGIDDINVVVTTGSYTNPAWIVSLPWTKITGTPTTLAGYGITDAYTQTQVNTLLNAKQNTLTLTTTGTSGVATLIGATLNIPDYGGALGAYLPLAGGTMTGNINWAQTDRGLTWAFNTDGASIKFYNTSDGGTDSRLEFATLDNDNEYFRWVHIPSGGSLYESMRLVPNSSGNAQLIVSGSIIKSGGTSSQFLMADGSVNTSVNPSGAYLPLSGGTLTGALGGTSATFSGAVETNRISTGNVTPFINVGVSVRGTITGNNDTWGVYAVSLTHAPIANNALSVGFATGGTVNRGTFTGLSYRGFYQLPISVSGSGTLATAYGMYIESLSGATNNYSAYFAQRVGIGTDAPISLLEVSAIQPDITLTSIDNTQYSRLVFREGNNGVGGLQFVNSNFNPTPSRRNTLELFTELGVINLIPDGSFTAPVLSVRTAGSTFRNNLGVAGAAATYPLTVFNGGNGTTAAFGGTARGLRVDNDGTNSSGMTSLFGVDNSFYGSYQPIRLAGSTVYLGIGHTNNVVTITPSGRVLINTPTESTFQLDVNGSLRVQGNNPAVRTDNTSNYTSLVSFLSGTRSWQLDNVNNDFWLYIAASLNTYAFSISSSTGNVGVGNTNAASKLHISGGGDGSGGGKGNIRSSDAGGGNYWEFGRDNLTTGDFVITNFGSSPYLRLATLTGAATFSSSVTATKGFFSSNAASDSTTALLANASTNDSSTYAALFGSLNAGYRMVVRADGNVGIGINSPVVLFNIERNVSGTSLGDGMLFKMKNTSTTTNTRSGINFGNIDGIGGSLAMQSAILKNAATGEYDMTWDLYGGSAGWQEGLLYLDSNPGRVGIGTTSPSQRLDVNGYIRATSGFVGNGGLSLWGDNSSSAAGLFVATGGNVGIRNLNPQAYLDVAGIADQVNFSSLLIRAGNSDDDSPESNQILFGYAGTNQYAHAIKTRHQSGGQAGNSIEFWVWQAGDSLNTPARQRVMSAEGNGVRIANLSGALINPVGGSVLTVNGSGYFSSSVTATNLLTTSMSGSAINIRGDESLNSNFGITWTTPTYNGGIAAIRVARRGASDASDMMFFTSPNGDVPNERMRITSGGNVLIGTQTDPGVNRVLSVERSQNGVSSVAMINSSTGSAASAQFIISANNSSGFYGAFSSTHATTNWAGRSVFGTNALGDGITISAHNSGQDIRFLTGSTSNIRMVVASNGNVLINTTDNPGATLHVNGTIRTGAPSGGTAVNWRLGTARGGPVTSNATVRVEIDGVLVDLVARYV